MSLDSSFWIHAAATTKDVHRLLIESGHFSAFFGTESHWRLVADGVLVSASTPILAHRPDFLHQVGVAANLHIYFANTDKTKTAAWTLSSVRAVVSLLTAYPGDALFMYCSDSPALLRRKGKVVLDSRAGLWMEGVSPNVIELVPQPYSWGEISIT